MKPDICFGFVQSHPQGFLSLKLHIIYNKSVISLIQFVKNCAYKLNQGNDAFVINYMQF
jgi:hypothetical protein